MNDKMMVRCDQLFKLGMKFNGDSYIGSEPDIKDFNVHHTEISFSDDVKWESIIYQLSTELNRRRIHRPIMKCPQCDTQMKYHDYFGRLCAHQDGHIEGDIYICVNDDCIASDHRFHTHRSNPDDIHTGNGNDWDGFDSES